MLKSIRIRNFALAADLSVEFAPGLNILTGETGAGKSVLVGAIAAVLGGRVYTEVVRTGFDKAQVDAVADIEKLPGLMALLEEKGLGGGTELFLRREISVKGNSRAFVNDSPVTVGTLSEIGDYLVDIHGQHEHQTLLRRETHRGILDDLGGLSNELAGVGQRYVKLNEDLHRLEALKRRQKELEDQYELNNFQFQEIENARLQSGEEEELNAELKVLSNVEKLFSLCATLNNLFSGEAFSLLQGAQEADVKLKELARYATELGSISEEVSSARIVLEEAARSVESFESSLAYDPERLEAVQSRLEVINLLKKKYGGSVEAVLAHQQKLAESLDLRNNFEGEISRLGKQVAESAANYARAAETLSSGRHRAAEAMQASVAEKLMDLGMPRIRFRAAVELTPDPRGIYLKDGERYSGDGHGIDAVEFF
nr:AAA family ATPase [Calditrichia bacterium]